MHDAANFESHNPTNLRTNTYTNQQPHKYARHFTADVFPNRFAYRQSRHKRTLSPTNYQPNVWTNH
jgi:hypothetical protein